jgi:hypothetical protein
MSLFKLIAILQGVEMKFIKTKAILMGFALVVSLSTAAMSEAKVIIKLTDQSPNAYDGDVVNYLMTYQDDLARYLPDGQHIEINIFNMVIPNAVNRMPQIKATVGLGQNDGVVKYGSGAKKLDIPGGYLGRPYRMQFEYSIVDDAGNIVKQDKKSLKLDGALSADRSKEPFIEHLYMLNKWMNKEFSARS